MGLKDAVSITGISSVSPLGVDLEQSWQNYLNMKPLMRKQEFGKGEVWCAPLSVDAKTAVQEAVSSERKYQGLDPSVHYAILASRNAIKRAGWESGSEFGVNLGSSRGATSIWESFHQTFLESGRSDTLTSPHTTLGNLSSWVAQDLSAKGPAISHSITCSTALHAILNGLAWIRSGLTDKFLAGGAEAPLTPFTISQMESLKLYSKEEGPYPCRTLDTTKKRNTLVLGEGASVACLQRGVVDNTLAIIEGWGYALEDIRHPVSLSADAQCIQDSMRMALGALSPDDIDVVVMHAPGTVLGDRSELEAIRTVFGENAPALTTNKWQTGHTFGASGMLSVEMALLMLHHQKYIGIPFISSASKPEKLERILVNAVGFGGNAVTILLRRP